MHRLLALLPAAALPAALCTCAPEIGADGMAQRPLAETATTTLTLPEPTADSLVSRLNAASTDVALARLPMGGGAQQLASATHDHATFAPDPHGHGLAQSAHAHPYVARASGSRRHYVQAFELGQVAGGPWAFVDEQVNLNAGGSSGGITGVAPVALPSGASLTDLRCFVQDDSAIWGLSLSAELRRHADASGATSVVATASAVLDGCAPAADKTSGVVDSGAGTVDPGSALIDSAASYTLRVEVTPLTALACGGSPSYSSIAFYGCAVDYEVP